MPDRYIVRVVPAGGADLFVLGIFAWALLGFANIYCGVAQRAMETSPCRHLSRRHRFVLSAGHASTLLYAMLHLTGVKSVNPKYEVLGEAARAVG